MTPINGPNDKVELMGTGEGAYYEEKPALSPIRSIAGLGAVSSVQFKNWMSYSAIYKRFVEKIIALLS